MLAGCQDMYLDGWATPSADVAGSIAAFHSANFGSGGNRSFYSNAELDLLIEQAGRELDESKRAELN